MQNFQNPAMPGISPKKYPVMNSPMNQISVFKIGCTDEGQELMFWGVKK